MDQQYTMAARGQTWKEGNVIHVTKPDEMLDGQSV